MSKKDQYPKQSRFRYTPRINSNTENNTNNFNPNSSNNNDPNSIPPVSYARKNKPNKSRFIYNPPNNAKNSKPNQTKSNFNPTQSKFIYTPGINANSNAPSANIMNTTTNNNKNNNYDNNNNNNDIIISNNYFGSELTRNGGSCIEQNYVASVLSNFKSADTIRFSTGLSLDSLDSVFWEEGTMKRVEFFIDEPVWVSLVSIDDTTHLTKLLDEIDDGHPMSIDFEWEPDFSRHSQNPISLFQVASSKGVLVVLNSVKVLYSNVNRSEEFISACPNLLIMKNFFISHSFYGKGMGIDKKKLRQLFDTTFNFEDIEKSRVSPHCLPRNFNQLLNNLVGMPAAQFKDKSVTISNWSNRPLTAKQALYAAFDAYAIRRIMNAIITKYNEEEIIPTV